MGTPTRQNVNITWLFDKVTEEFSGDIINPLAADNELLSVPSSPLVQPARLETTCQTVSTQACKLQFSRISIDDGG